VKVTLLDCANGPISDIQPPLRIALVPTGDTSIEPGDFVPESTSAADTTGFMRPTDQPGQYIYNMSTSGQTAGAKNILIKFDGNSSFFTKTIAIPIVLVD